MGAPARRVWRHSLLQGGQSVQRRGRGARAHGGGRAGNAGGHGPAAQRFLSPSRLVCRGVGGAPVRADAVQRQTQMLGARAQRGWVSGSDRRVVQCGARHYHGCRDPRHDGHDGCDRGRRAGDFGDSDTLLLSPQVYRGGGPSEECGGWWWFPWSPARIVATKEEYSLGRLVEPVAPGPRVGYWLAPG